LSIKIIRPTAGLNTTDRILDIVRANPQGISVRTLSDQLNRPVSMINRCLKSLVAAKKILARKDNNQWIYRPDP
jgi:DNA-binding IclR family transcriptional regulator